MSEQEKLFPTKFPGYYVSRYREPIKRDHTKELVEVSEWFRGGAHTKQYKSVNISLKDESGKTLRQIKYYSHNLTEVNHLDEDKLNNSVNNLKETLPDNGYELGL